MDLEQKENDLIGFMSPMYPHCGSRDIVKNGTCLRMIENGPRFRDCRYSLVARPPDYGNGKHFQDDVREKGIHS